MSFSSIQITSKGRALLARAQTGTVINFSRIKMGDGSMSGQAIDEMTDVISQKADLNINSLKVLTGGKAKVSATFTNQGLSTGFYWRELAVFATDPDNPSVDIMYCYGNAGALADYIPAEGSQILERVISVLTIISNAANVTATIDSSNVYVTVQDAEATYLKKSLATAASQFLVSSAAGQWVIKTIAELKTLLGLGSAAEKNFNTSGGVASYDTVSTHLSDYVRQPGYGVTAGSANTYTLTLSPAPAAYTDGMGIVVKIHTTNTGAATINVNGLGVKPMVDGKGSALAVGKLKINAIYSLKYNSAWGTFQLQGEGGEIPKLPNLIKNGNFGLSTNCWEYVNVNVTTSNNILTFTATSQWGYVMQRVPKPAINDKFYIRCEMNAATGGRMYFSHNNGMAVVELYPSVPSNWAIMSGAGIYPSNGTISQLFFDDIGASGWQPVQVRNVTFFNLTQMFGPGNEPTKEEIDAMVQKNGGWWDSDLPLFTTDANTSVGDVLANKIFYTAGGVKAFGSMPERTFAATGGAYTPASSWRADGGGALCIRPQEGYYKNEVNVNEFGPIIANDPNFIPANIRSGKSIFGLAGSFSGKRWASGTITYSSSTAVSFTDISGSISSYFYPLTISGLTFKPTKIILRTNISGQVYYTIYEEGSEQIDYPKVVRIVLFLNGFNSVTNYSIKGDVAPVSVTPTGFTLPVVSGAVHTYVWEAYE